MSSQIVIDDSAAGCADSVADCTRVRLMARLKTAVLVTLDQHRVSLAIHKHTSHG